ncbi:MAG: DUF4173 domain-containing protein [Candidatus Saccharimonadales bacterium]|jgi:hypothetical protein
MKFQRQVAILIIVGSVLAGLLCDLLVRQTLLGLNFLLFTLIWVAVCFGFVLRRRQSLPSPITYGLIAVTNAVFVCWRAEPAVQTWSAWTALFALALLATTVFFENFKELPLLQRFPAALSHLKHTAHQAPTTLGEAVSQRPAKPLHINRGVIGAAGLAVVFIILFASADQIFGKSFDWAGTALSNLADLLSSYDIGRFFTVSFWATISLIVLFGLFSRRHAPATARAIKPSLTGRDAVTILATLVVIFAVFVLVQLRYLFAGGSLPSGLTYASYAHRGYGQLLLATLLATAVVKYIISALKTPATIRVKLLAAALIVLNGVVVLSAWKRLSLYETTYGWTMLRFVARLGLICILLGSVSVLAWLWGKLNSRQLYASNWYIIVAVLMSAAVLNPAGIIARKNIAERTSRTVILDTDYLMSLSPDAWPAICSSAPSLKTSHPLEYRQLRTEFEEYQPETSRGLSRHHTAEKSYVDRYKHCLK